MGGKESMGFFHDRKVKKALKRLKSYDPKLFKSLNDVHARDVRRYFDKVNKYAKRRVEIIRKLGQLGDARAVEPLISLLKYFSGKWEDARSYSVDEEKEIVEALGKIGDKRAIPAIREHVRATSEQLLLPRRFGGWGRDSVYTKALLQLGDSQLLEVKRRFEEQDRKITEKLRERRRMVSNRSEISKLLTSLKIIQESDPLVIDYVVYIWERERPYYRTLKYYPSHRKGLKETVEKIRVYWKGAAPSCSIINKGKELMIETLRRYMSVVRLGENSFYIRRWSD